MTWTSSFKEEKYMKSSAAALPHMTLWTSRSKWEITAMDTAAHYADFGRRGSSLEFIGNMVV
jgi:hypothetical protein